MNGNLSGYGRYISMHGYYIGDFKDDSYNGLGTFVCSDGTTYVGAYKDNMRHGQGKFTKADGTVFEGDWVEDKLNGDYL